MKKGARVRRRRRADADRPTPIDARPIERASARGGGEAGRRSAARSLPSIEGRDPRCATRWRRSCRRRRRRRTFESADAVLRLGVRDLAFDHYSDALTLEPRNAAAFDGRARVWRDWGFVGLALADAHRARYYQPASATVRNTLGTILELRGLCREALAEYREALRLKPDAAWAQQNVTRLTDTCW